MLHIVCHHFVFEVTIHHQPQQWQWQWQSFRFGRASTSVRYPRLTAREVLEYFSRFKADELGTNDSIIASAGKRIFSIEGAVGGCSLVQLTSVESDLQENNEGQALKLKIYVYNDKTQEWKL